MVKIYKMKIYKNLFLLFLLVFFVLNSNANNEIKTEEDSISKDPIVVTPSYYMIGNMSSNLPFDPNIKLDTLASNKLVCYVKKNYASNAETVIELVYKVGSLMEDSTRRAQAFFTANYVAKYYSSIISNKFNGRINPNIKVEAKPNYTRFVFSIVATDADRKDAVADFLKVLADSISFNSTLLATNKIDFITRYKQNQFTELQYNLGKQPTAKYLNSITVVKLKQFYKDWYRPNLTSVIVVGNIDVEQTQKELSAIFSKLKNPVKEKNVVYYGIPKKPTLQLTIVDDTSLIDKGIVQFYLKKIRNNRESTIGYIETILGILSAIVIENLSNDYNKKDTTGRYFSAISYEPFTKNEDAIVLNFKFNIAYLDTMTIELLSLKDNIKNGVVINEKQLNKSKLIYLNNLKNNKNILQSSTDYTTAILNHFIYNIPLIGKEQEFDFTNSFIDKLFSSNDFNSFFGVDFDQENISIVIKKPVEKRMLFNSKLELIKKYNQVFPKK